MQIIIPMSGFGERFRRAGYAVPKPLIEIDGKPIIGHVIDMFPGETDFIFICNQDHLDEPLYRMKAILHQLCPTGKVVGIAPHKLGPIHAVLQIEALVNRNAPVLVNYCDFTCYWDWAHFTDFVRESACDGALPAYKGFHPHTLGSTNYAYMRESGGWVSDIQEKQPYTDNRMEEYASSGSYYFRSGALMLESFEATVKQNIQVGGEYYVSLAYKPLLASGGRVAVYPLQHFMQWGTPDDVTEYLGWSAAFRRLAEPSPRHPGATGTLIVPMAGLGQRFVNEGYQLTKPLIEVSGRAMVAQATADLPAALQHAFVLRRDMPGFEQVSDELRHLFPSVIIETVATVTEGQACTALLGLDAVVGALGDAPGPVTFGACDNGLLYDEAAFAKLAGDDAVDIIVWSARGLANAARHPQMFGWIDEEGGRIRTISVKTPLDAPATDPIVIGAFTFRRADHFKQVVERLIARNGRINGEFYIDSCINDAIELGMKCVTFDVDHLLSWGTPNDLRTFEYWQACFHKWKGHVYRLELDGRIPPDKVAGLEARYAACRPALPVGRA